MKNIMIKQNLSPQIQGNNIGIYKDFCISISKRQETNRNLGRCYKLTDYGNGISKKLGSIEREAQIRKQSDK